MTHPSLCLTFFFFFNDTATTEIYTLSLHDALPISFARSCALPTSHAGLVATSSPRSSRRSTWNRPSSWFHVDRSEEHTSELQSQSNLVCRLLLEKKKNIS